MSVRVNVMGLLCMVNLVITEVSFLFNLLN